MEQLNEKCKIIVEAIRKFGLYFKEALEPFNQLQPGDKRLTGEKIVHTLGYSWDIEEDVISSTMEPSLVSKKRGMSREIPLSVVEDNNEIVTKRALAVLTASIVSTDGILSAPLQLGAKLLLSRAATLCAGTDSVKWTVPLKTIDSDSALKIEYS